MAQRLLALLLSSFLVIQVLRAQQIFYLDGNFFLNPYYYLQPQLLPGFRSGRDNLPLPKEQILYCNTEPSRPIPSSANNVRSNQFQQPYLFRDGEQDSIIDLRATKEDKKLILELHNQLRQKVASERESRGSPGPQPAAISMPNLKWSDELANNAWEWAQNLQYKHEPDPIKYGQNLHMSFSPHSKNMSDWANIINGKDGWFDEVDNMDCANVIKFRSCQTTSGKVIGHYTQMVWAETTHVGCAAIGYYDDYNGYPFTPGQPYKQFYICNYSPRGNAPNKSVYKVDYSSSAYSDCPNQPE
ncbi:venom allergen 5-like [Daphnia pulex]|uniref:venom allergen 5-like n=1 Tax=Daphnia pulex TaxID=6669 RepID=UPI001EE057AF|nr:venom allergen 5-like [Daphnia pulex]